MGKPFMRIEMGRALHGDCLFVEWGDGKDRRRMLIDGGPIGAYAALETRLRDLSRKERAVELVVLSHVDTDHIEGVVRLFAEPPSRWPIDVHEVWFNGWRHHDATADELLGGNQGEFFSALLARRLEPECWNRSFKGKAVVVPRSGVLPTFTLEGGLKLTLLSPDRPKLDKMANAWRKDIDKKGIRPGDLEAAWKALSGTKRYLPKDGLLSGVKSLDALIDKQFKKDSAPANGASIAFLAEHDGGSCLFLADAHSDVVCASLRRLLKTRNQKRLKVDAVKVSHHGSKSNTDDDLMSLIESPRFLISSNGNRFEHPDKEAIMRIVERSSTPPTLFFNYKTKFNQMWETPTGKARKHHSVFNDGDGPMIIALSGARRSKKVRP